MTWLVWLVVLACAYLLGSIPTGYLFVKLKSGKDIRQMGSGNVGSTNTVRVAGKKIGLLVFVIDVGKSFVATWLAHKIGGDWMAVCAGLIAILGHMFPLWLNFRGGKGVACSLGISLALTPWVGLAALAAWLVIAVGTGYVSIGSCSAILFAALVALFTQQPWLYTLLYFVVFALVTVKHRSNFVNLAHGTENKSFRKKK